METFVKWQKEKQNKDNAQNVERRFSVVEV
jgi:hypothetical protein